MKTIEDLKEEITRIKNIDHEGFDNNLVFRKFARDQALINIELIKPYTDKYDLIVAFLVTGKDSYAAAVAAYAIADTPTPIAAFADADSATDIATDYTKAIESLTALSNEYLALAETEGDLGHNFELGE